MARPQVFTWPAQSTTAIAALQTLAGAGNMLINGSLSNNGLVYFDGYSRVITLTSTNNLSGVNFTITGMLQGSLQTETRGGPNNNTVATTALFDSISSITTNGAAAAVSSGTGSTGQTQWSLYNFHAPYAALGIAVEVSGTINYSFQTTFDDVNTTAETVFTPITDMTGATTEQIAVFNIPTRYSNIIINSSTGAATLKATFIQQGI